MRIHRIKLENYRGVTTAEIVFMVDGVTIVEGPNEVGKTSLVEAIDLILKYPDSTDKAAVRVVRPVHIDAIPSVELEWFSWGFYGRVLNRICGSDVVA
jgi:predicted ATPase